MNHASSLLVGAMLLALLTGCTWSPVSSTPVLPAQLTKLQTPLYYLPRTEFELTVVLDAYVKSPVTPPAQDGSKPADAAAAAKLPYGTIEKPVSIAYFLAEIDKPVTFSVATVPDLGHAFSIQQAADLFADSKFEMTLSDLGLLTGYSADVDDKTSSVISNTIGSAASLAVALAKSAAEPTEWRKTGVRYTLTERFSAMRLVGSKSRRCQFLAEALQTLKAANSEHRLASVVGVYGGVSVPVLELQLGLEQNLTLDAGTSVPEAAAWPDKSAEGIYYRAANPRLVDLLADDQKIGTTRVNIADNAPLAFVKVTARRFSHRVDNLGFAAATGSLNSLKSSSTSAADAAAQSMKASVDALAKLQTDLLSAKKDKATRANAKVGYDYDAQILEVQIQAKTADYNAATGTDKAARYVELLTLQKQLAQLKEKMAALDQGITL